jgi:hypothetical protein
MLSPMGDVSHTTTVRELVDLHAPLRSGTQVVFRVRATWAHALVTQSLKMGGQHAESRW